MFGSMFVSMPVFMSLSKSVSLSKSMSLSVSMSLSSDADPVELLYGSGSRIRKSSIQIRIQGKNLTKFNFSKFCGKNVLTDIEQQLYIKLAKVPRGQLRSQKSCKVP